MQLASWGANVSSLPATLQVGLIARITEATEQVFKLPEAALPAVGAAAPLLQALGASPLGALVAGGQPAAAGAAPPQRQQFMPSSNYEGSSGGFGSDAAGGRDSSRLSASSAAPSRAQAAAARPTAAPTTVAAGSAGNNPQPGGSAGSDLPGGSLAALSGTWVKDFAASDLEAYSRACDLLQLGGLQKTTALQLIEGMDIEQQGQRVAVRYLTGKPRAGGRGCAPQGIARPALLRAR